MGDGRRKATYQGGEKRYVNGRRGEIEEGKVRKGGEKGESGGKQWEKRERVKGKGMKGTRGVKGRREG